LRRERGELASERILDAAGRLFVEQGVATTGMGDVARAAGCSRATLYRYFENRHELRTAYVDRAARRIGAEVQAGRPPGAGPAERLVGAVLDVLDRVRRDPALAVWFGPADSGLASTMARSTVIETMVTAFLGDLGDLGDPGDLRDGAADAADRARWLVRVVVSLLAHSGADADDERRLLTRYVVPVVVDPTPAVPQGA
jgi:AcrR family transcriptional regulator